MSAARGPRATCTKYASPSGADASRGTKRRPYKTAQRLVDSLHRGQTGCLRGGSYEIPGGLEIHRSDFTLRSYPGEDATLHGITEVLPGSNNVTLSNLNFVGDGTAITVKTYSSDTTIVDSDITNNRLGGSCLLLGSDYGTAVRPRILRNRIHDCGMGHLSYPAEHGIYAGVVSGGKVTDNVIYNINEGYAIQLYWSSQGLLVDHNVIDGGPPSLRGGITFSGEASNPSSDNIVEYNIIAYATTYDITSWWGGAAGSGNVARSNCVWAGALGNIYRGSDNGFASTRNISANPLFVNRAHHDFRLRSRS
ncbi:MAG: right-handed parallel beta-helix repeat-containing protein, partial [Actinomycetota bacterium]|nr:right-handed parallel beta-helix repeat-containing protein [Actinomycetota bacterium]